MNRHSLLTVAACAAVLAALVVVNHGAESVAGDAIHFARTPHIANDGRIAFTYYGDIWTAEADGSRAQRLTTHVANDFDPRFSPDGEWIAFTSARTGNNDVFVVRRGGGEPRQLTFHSADDRALYWMPDGKAVLVATSRGAFPFGSPLYRVPLDGGTEEPLDMAFARVGMMKQDGTLLAFNRTLPSSGIWRKGFRGNSAPGIAVQDMKTGRISEITNADMRDYRNHFQDVFPMWGADGQIYFASERDGTYNIWRLSPRGGAPQQVTRFKEGGVFQPSISPDGRRLIFLHDFDLWTLELPSGTPRKLTIPLSFDPKENDITLMTANSIVNGFSPAPDGESVAVIVRGDIQIVPAQQGIGEDTPVARTPWRESGARFSPDGKQLAYYSDQDGDQDVWIYDVAAGTSKRLTSQPFEKADILWAKNSQKLLYTGDNRIWELDLSTSQPVPTELAYNRAGGFRFVNYAVNGTWLTYTRSDDIQNLDGYLYDMAAKKEYNVTRHPASDQGVQLTPDGKSVVFVSNRSGATRLYVTSLTRLTEDRNDPLVRERQRVSAAAGRGGRGNAPAAAAPTGGAPPAPLPGALAAPASEVAPALIETEGIDKRALQLTGDDESAGQFFFSSDGRSVFFVASGGAGGRGGLPPELAAVLGAAAEPAGTTAGLYSIGLDGRDRRQVATGAFGGVTPTPDRRTVFFTRPPDGAQANQNQLNGTALYRMPLVGGRQERVNFTLQLRIDRRTEWRQMFGEISNILGYRYYDRTMNGFDWNAIHARYAPLLAHVGTNEDFYDLANAMGGELRSSHLGVTGPATYPIAATYATRFLGFELAKADSGYRISHIYRDGPADKEWLSLAVGDLVLEIDGQPLSAIRNFWKVLSDKTNQYVPVKVAKSATADPRVVRIATVTDINDIRYNDYVTRNRELVEKRTNGRVGYAHIRQMNPESLTKFQSDVERDWNKDGFIVDVRYNNGGNIDEPLLEILQRRPYMFVNPRDGAPVWGRRPGRAIAGPKVMLINQRSFSDAEATPMGFRTLGLGKLVGTPTAGGVIWTNTFALINGATMRVPFSRAAVYDASKPDGYGTNLENYGVPPDVWVQNSLEDERKGVDRELEAAVDEVMRQLSPSTNISR